jgi:hypothetical protein
VAGCKARASLSWRLSTFTTCNCQTKKCVWFLYPTGPVHAAQVSASRCHFTHITANTWWLDSIFQASFQKHIGKRITAVDSKIKIFQLYCS